MAIRATPDNLSLDFPSDAAVPAGRIAEFAEVWAHRESLRQACTRMIGDPARAEDLVQETFLSAIRSGPRLEPRESMGPWLATVARRRSIDELRGRRRLSVVPTPPEPEPTVLDDPAEQFLSQELITQLRVAIAELTPRERQLLLRQATYGLSLSDLAAEEETSVASVRSVLTRARQKVRMSLERGGALGGLPVPRWLLNLRDKVARSAYLWEPALPSLAGAGAQAVVAIVAAVALLIGGIGATPAPEHSLTMIGVDSGLASAASGGHQDVRAGAPGSPRSASSAPAGDGTSSAASGNPVGSPLPPPPVPLPTLPPDHHQEVDSISPSTFARSDTGEHVYALGTASGWTLKSALFRSTDNGKTWARVETLNWNLDGRILLPPTYPMEPTIFIATSTHLLRSDDAGASFVAVAPTRGGSSVMLSPDYLVDRRILIAGTPFLAYNAADNTTVPLSMATPSQAGSYTLLTSATYDTDTALLLGGTVRKSDGITTSAVFRCTPSGCGAPVVLPFGGGAPPLVRMSSGAVVAYEVKAATGVAYYSTDDGASFQQRPLPPLFDPKALLEGPTGEIIVAGYRFNGGVAGIYRSIDNGASWQPVGMGSDQAVGITAMIKLSSGALLTSPIWGRYGVLCSNDSGTSWSSRC